MTSAARPRPDPEMTCPLPSVDVLSKLRRRCLPLWRTEKVAWHILALGRADRSDALA
jgi:hypothetical protein